MRRATLTQYNVLLPNEPRKFAKVAKLLAKAKVGRRTVLTARSGRSGSVQFLAYRDPELRRKLEKSATAVQENQIFEFEVPNHPWEFHRVAQALAEAGIRIISLFSSANGPKLRIILAVDQPANAVETISRLGFSPDYLVC